MILTSKYLILLHGKSNIKYDEEQYPIPYSIQVLVQVQKKYRISVLRIRIRDPMPFDPWDGKKVSIRIRDEQPGSYFLELRNNFFRFFWGLKYLNSLIRIRDGDSSDPGWKKVGSGIRDKHPGSATLEGSAKCRHLKNLPVKGLCGRCLSKFMDRRYMLVFSTQLCELLPL